jgi:hypothetical protein
MNKPFEFLLAQLFELLDGRGDTVLDTFGGLAVGLMQGERPFAGCFPLWCSGSSGLVALLVSHSPCV